MSEHNCTITPITEEDITGFHAALDVVSKEKKYLDFQEAPPLESTRTFVQDNIKNDYAQFVARVDGKVIGWCDITPASSRQTRKHVGVLGIGILPAFRGKGIGRRLMQAAIEKATRQGLTRIELAVREKNKNAITLYKKLGFKIEGLKINSSKIDDVYQNDHIMALLV